MIKLELYLNLKKSSILHVKQIAIQLLNYMLC